MRAEQDGLAAGREFGDQAAQNQRGVDVEAGERFIEQDEVGVVQQRGDVSGLNLTGTGSAPGPEVGSGFFDNLRDSGWLSFRGRLARKDYWITLAIAHLLLLFARVGTVFLPGFPLPRDIPTQILGLGLAILGLLLSVLWFWVLLAALVKRLHDCNANGWIAALVFPLGYFLIFLPFIVLGCIKGTAGPNCYGDDPLAFL